MPCRRLRQGREIEGLRHRSLPALTLGTVLVMATAVAIVVAQRGGRGGRGGALPSYYTSRSAPLGPVDTSVADRACQTSQGHARLVCLADLLKKDLSGELLARLQSPYSRDDAGRWSNFPPMGYRDRIGPTLAEFTPAQLGVVKALMKEATGIATNEGYDEIEQILNADDFLKNNTGENGFASGNFQIAFVGTPAATGTWELYFGGHHLAFGSTYTDGVLVGATPSFRGVEPFTTFRENGRENAPMAQEQAAFAAMFAGLSDAEHTKARLAQTYTDIIVGPQRDDNFPTTKAGLRAGDLSQDKRELVMRAIETYVRDINPPDADAVLARYRTGLAETHIAYGVYHSLLVMRRHRPKRVVAQGVRETFSVEQARHRFGTLAGRSEHHADSLGTRLSANQCWGRHLTRPAHHDSHTRWSASPRPVLHLRRDSIGPQTRRAQNHGQGDRIRALTPVHRIHRRVYRDGFSIDGEQLVRSLERMRSGHWVIRRTGRDFSHQFEIAGEPR